MTQKTSLTKRNIFASITADSQVDTRATPQTNTNQTSATKLSGGSNYQVFTNTTIFTYNRPVKYNVQILNEIKSTAKGFIIFIVRIPGKILLYQSGHHIT